MWPSLLVSGEHAYGRQLEPRPWPQYCSPDSFSQERPGTGEQAKHPYSCACTRITDMHDVPEWHTRLGTHMETHGGDHKAGQAFKSFSARACRSVLLGPLQSPLGSTVWCVSRVRASTTAPLLLNHDTVSPAFVSEKVKNLLPPTLRAIVHLQL